MVSHHTNQTLLKPKFDFKALNWIIVNDSNKIDETFSPLLDAQNISRDELKLIEQFTSDAKTSFVCVYHRSQPVLLFPIQEIWLSKAHFPGFKRTFWQRLASLFIDLSCMNLLFSGSLLQINKSYLTYNPDQISDAEAFQFHLDIICSLRKEKSFATQMLHLPKIMENDAQISLQNWGFHQPLPDYEMKLNLRSHWTNWETYLADLTKKYAVRAGKIRNAIHELETRFLSLQDIENLETEIQLLYLQTVQKQEILLTKAKKGYFTNLKQLCGDDFQMKGFFKEGKLLAFYSWFEHVECIEMHFIGIDYKHNAAYQLYFNILYEGMLDGMHLGKKSVLYGRTSLEAKASLGAVAVHSPTYLWLGLVNTCLSDTLQEYISVIENHTWKERNPLKNGV